jgi:Cellulase (glycosyl hydrolase family 5)/Secretion system C-terminal sorting domain
MKRQCCIAVFLVLWFAVDGKAQLSPQDAAKGMTRGINVGNTMEPPTEGAWGNPPLQEHAFDDYKNAGFTAVRIPITWDGHTSTTSPYAIDAAWLARVEQVVDWGLQRGLFITINAHHETWIKNSFTAANVARFDSIWSQIAARFKSKSDSLMFEIINEPHPMTMANVNALNAQVLKIIRRTNPTRIVSFSGDMWSNSDELVTAAIPDTSDKYLIGYYHSYDPYPFGLIGTGRYGSAADINATKAKFDQVTAWSKRNNIPVLLGEFGVIDTADYNSRMCAYGTVVDQALSHGVPSFAWDDGGWFPVYNRITGGFNEIKDILIHMYPQSPNGMKIGETGNHAIRLQWHNRNTEDDSIVIERRAGISSASFGVIGEVASTDSAFIDTSTSAGTPYYYRLRVTMKDSVELQSYPIMLNPVATSVRPLNVAVGFKLYDNYPNPFNPTTNIQFAIAHRQLTIVNVYDVLGREVATLVNEVKEPGTYTVQFSGSGLASGVYFYRLQAGSFVQTKKLLLLR